MSSLWTPGGEHPVDDRPPKGSGGDQSGGGSGRSGEGGRPARQPRSTPPGQPDGDEAAIAIDELRRQLAESPPDVVVANHAYGMFELAAIYLSQNPPMLEAARLAIDAMGSLVDGLEGRLGENEPSLKEALAQVRLAFVQLEAAARATGSDHGAENGSTASTGEADL